MRKKHIKILGFVLLAAMCVAGCDSPDRADETESSAGVRVSSDGANEILIGSPAEESDYIVPTTQIMELEDGFSTVRYDGDYGWDEFIAQGGASSDSEVIQFLTSHLQLATNDLIWQEKGFGCSTLSAQNEAGERLFGRNFDWQNCDAMVVLSQPETGYASISTVNMDFIQTGYGGGISELPEKMRTILSLYAPLDGMNERGLGVSVNMIQDSAVIGQDSDKPDLTTTTAIRLLLNQAADVEEALALLKQYDMHSSMGMMVHFVLTDASGRSVAVEYINDEMAVTETPVVTNFYLAQGEKQGIGSVQSHTRYDALMKRLREMRHLDMDGMKDALDSVSKKNFGEFESTEWSIVFNQSSREVRYYHRENYDKAYTFQVE